MCVDILLFIISCAVFLFVYSGTRNESYSKLLQIEDFTVEKKQREKKNDAIAGVYWCLVTAVYLFISFYYMNWGKSWIIWPCAGVLFAAIMGIVNIVQKNKDV